MLFCIFLLTSCSSTKEEECPETILTYKIYYPSNTVTKTYRGKLCSYYENSNRGSNEIGVTYWKVDGGVFSGGGTRRRWIEQTSVPIEIVSFRVIK